MLPALLSAALLHMPTTDARHLAAYTKLTSEDGKHAVQLVTLSFRQPDPGPFAGLDVGGHDPYWDRVRLRTYWLRVGDATALSGPNVPDAHSDRVTFRLPGDLDLTKADWHVYTRLSRDRAPAAGLPGHIRFRVTAADLAAVGIPYRAEVRDVAPRCDAKPNDSNGRFTASVRFNYWPRDVRNHRIGALESISAGRSFVEYGFRGAHGDRDANARSYELQPARDQPIAVRFEGVEGWFPLKPWPERTAAALPGGKTVTVAAVQCSSDLGDVAANTKKLSHLTWTAARHGAKFVVLPETAVTGYLSQDLKTNWHVKGMPIEAKFEGKDPDGFAETVPGPSTKHFCALAKELGIYLTIPLLEVDRPKGKESRYFNTVCLANPKGDLVAHYRKLTPWPYPEKSWATAGDRGVQTYDTEYGRVGLGICFDIHTILEKYEAHKLWCLLYPIAWVDTEHPAEWMWAKLPERVKPFGHHLIGANWSVDKKQDWRGYGFSVVVSNEGKVLASAKNLYGSEIVYAELPYGQ